MMNKNYPDLELKLEKEPHVWLVTGCAGFIGSHLTERLLRLNQRVIGIDNFSTGRQSNLDDIKSRLSAEQISGFQFHQGDICDYSLMESLVSGANYVLHQAAIGSVPRSIKEPLVSHQSNVDGFCNLLVAATKSKKLKKIVFASSSSVYGDDQTLQKVESHVGKLLSPYAMTKKANELYGEVFSRTYGLKIIGLRYFNVFGPRQDPNGQYAAVIPKWIELIKRGEVIEVYGDGTASRDFCYIENVIQANLLAATVDISNDYDVFNVALNQSTSLNALIENLIEIFGKNKDEVSVRYLDFRKGDIYHSCADIRKARDQLGYHPVVYIRDGLIETVKAFFG